MQTSHKRKPRRRGINIVLEKAGRKKVFGFCECVVGGGGGQDWSLDELSCSLELDLFGSIFPGL
jgi:hypothetical protein